MYVCSKLRETRSWLNVTKTPPKSKIQLLYENVWNYHTPPGFKLGIKLYIIGSALLLFIFFVWFSLLLRLFVFGYTELCHWKRKWISILSSYVPNSTTATIMRISYIMLYLWFRMFPKCFTILNFRLGLVQLFLNNLLLGSNKQYP